ncbi:MAG: hypothetical protein K2M44_05300 [Clostridia bacterium]|nr:hypothetical protein [Clostridia bacterium]
MANKIFNTKAYRESYYPSIVEYNVECRMAIRLMPFTDSDGVTDFKCAIARDSDGAPAYIKEYFALMWGSTEVTQYCALKDDAFSSIVLTGEVKEAVEGGHLIRYSVKKGIFRRWYYNVLVEMDGVKYYLFIKTSAGSKFKDIMTRFCA